MKYLQDSWEQEHERIGGIYNYWGALLAVLFSPLAFLTESARPKDNETWWLLSRLVPVVLIALLIVLYKRKRLSHELLVQLTGLLLYTSRAYRVHAQDLTQYTISASIMFFTSAVIPVLRPARYAFNAVFALLVHLGMHVFYYKQSVAEHALIAGWVLTGIVVSHGIGIARYYYFKHQYIQRRLLNELLRELLHKQDQLERVSAVLQKQNEKLKQSIIRVKEGTVALERQKQALLEQQETLKVMLQKATQVQEGLLGMSREHLMRLFPESFVFFKGTSGISGDFYLCTRSFGADWLCVGDCTGHGVSGVLLSCASVMALADLVHRHKELTPERLLELYEERLDFYLHKEAVNLKTGADVGILKISPSGAASYAGRGIPLILIRQGNVYELSTSRAGVLANRLLAAPEPEQDKKVDVFLERGDSVYLLTDGFKDQLKESKRPQRYGRRRLFRLLEKAHGVPMARQHRLFEEEIQLWRAGKAFTDDITVVGFKVV
ncbi:PP2C family protein-serine/threonine phosphatase [Thermonema rossianum]|uniref:PP2C family protein-serine/threonine phosphatase n=1 Tax=Thermonema rossianum TaxID=55505 RepID=UPI00056F7E6B|nr:SpoIIE family protein phosphatase [Thermonema rossianum]